MSANSWKHFYKNLPAQGIKCNVYDCKVHTNLNVRNIGDELISGMREHLDGTNPKDLLGVKKPPLSLIPPSAQIEEAMAFAEGARKYGAYNWRSKKVKASIYADAALRHLLAWLDGEDIDPESGLPHECKVKACMSILIDARNTGNLVDDRPVKGAANEVLKRYSK